MPLRELLFGASVATVVTTTFLVGTTLATSLHIVETVLRTRLRFTGERTNLSVGSRRFQGSADDLPDFFGPSQSRGTASIDPIDINSVRPAARRR